jgi:hypothetical protein
MVTLPGWDSIDSAARLHRWFEILGFLALGLLLLFEVLAYIYGNRKDYLTSVAAGVAAETQREKQAKANQVRDAQIAEADRQARDARQAQMLAEERAAPSYSSFRLSSSVRL